MAGPQRHADLAVGLEAADAGPVPGPRVDHHERPLLRVDLDAFGRDDPHHHIVDRARQVLAASHDLELVAQHRIGLAGHVVVELIAALAQHIGKQDGPLRRVDRIGDGVGGKAGTPASHDLGIAAELAIRLWLAHPAAPPLIYATYTPNGDLAMICFSTLVVAFHRCGCWRRHPLSLARRPRYP